MYRYANITTLQLKNLISASPVIAAIAVLDYTFLSYKSGYYRCPKNATLFELNHVVTIIGYDSVGNWLIKNSWGLSWGHGGFGWILGSADCGLKYWIYQLN
jgi:cathepsin L